MSQFTMYDTKPDVPQVVRISWEMVAERDDCGDAPDERQDGYWPSQDPKDAGYSAEYDDPKKFAEAYADAKVRYHGWAQGEWWYVGVQARANIAIPVGGRSYHVLTLTSAGCWGIESDAGDYLKTVYREEKESLLQEIQVLTTAFMNGECEMEDIEK